MSCFKSTPLWGGVGWGWRSGVGVAGSHSIIFFSQDLPELDDTLQEIVHMTAHVF